MKTSTILGLFALVILITSCNTTTKDKSSSKETQATEPASTEISEKSAVIHLTTEEFKQKVFNYEAGQEWKYEGTVPCIVDFYADWCGPCKKVAPILEDLAKEYDGKIIIYKIDTDKERELSAAFGIRSIPTILFVPVKGEPQATQGALPKETFVKAINDVLLKDI